MWIPLDQGLSSKPPPPVAARSAQLCTVIPRLPFLSRRSIQFILLGPLPPLNLCPSHDPVRPELSLFRPPARQFALTTLRQLQ